MIGTRPPRWRSALVTSNPSIPGSIRSSRTSRGRSASTAARPEGPSVRHTTRKPSRSRYSRTRSAMDSSSSTSSTVPLEGCSGVNQSPFAVGPTLASPGQVRGGSAGRFEGGKDPGQSPSHGGSSWPVGSGGRSGGARKAAPRAGQRAPRRSASAPAPASSSPPAATRSGPARGVATRRPVPAATPSSCPRSARPIASVRTRAAPSTAPMTSATPRVSRASPTAQRPRPRVAATATSSTRPSRASPPRGARSLPVSSTAPSRAEPIPGSSTAALTLAHACPLPIAASMTPTSTASMAPCIDRRLGEGGAGGAGVGAGAEGAGVGAEGLWTPGAAPSGVGLFGGPGISGRGSGTPVPGSATGGGGDAGRVGAVGWGGHEDFGGGDGGEERAGLSFGLAFLAFGDGVGDHAGAGLAVGHADDEHAGAEGDAGVEDAGEVEVADAAGIGAAAVALQVVDDLHGPDLGGPRHRAGREARRQHVEGGHAAGQLTDHVRDQVHDVGVALDPHELVDPDGAGPADPAEVVAGQVDQHDVLGPLLLVGQELGLQGQVGLGVGAAGAGAGDRAHGGPAALDGDQHLGRGAGDGHPGQAQEVHVG